MVLVIASPPNQAPTFNSMPELLHIGFDNTHRFKKKSYLFQYKGIDYKLIQNNPRRWSDVLITIVPFNNETIKEKTFTNAGEFLSALSWVNHSPVSVQYLGGMGVPNGFNLRDAKCRVFDFPQTPFHGRILGSDLSIISAIKTEDQRKALVLFREAFSSNRRLFSFLLYWQILEIGGNKPVEWINKLLAHPLGYDLPISDIRQLAIGSKSLGEYLLDDCRHAIAHIKRFTGKTSLSFDQVSENLRLAISTNIVEQFARIHIVSNLNLKGHMYLFPQGRGRIPIFHERFAKP